jgi:hypothetical protein
LENSLRTLLSGAQAVFQQTGRTTPQISTEKSAQRGQINTADFSVWFPGQKIVECKKVPRMRAIAAFFEAGHAGSREMVFDLLVDAKPSPSW